MGFLVSEKTFGDRERRSDSDKKRFHPLFIMLFRKIKGTHGQR
ncbi:hypothetical protein ES288_D09G147500v1 [Gossypium darwinii]|uniref:Uncharacterized protein n=1 Tax=Gossypium darwinii TaxID=34276 RepID=A0A5D2B9A5_GOSDA|nr:hypothetical protein ES288_D09G147500v1 [Gossypium darwinii]